MAVDILIKSFDELTNEELYQILRLRAIVFVVEQDCPYNDVDNKDQEAFHLFIMEEKEVVAYSRLIAPGNAYENYSAIGRVITSFKKRKTGLGKKIMQSSIDFCLQQWPNHDIKLSAQVYALPFYQNLGFKEIGPIYLEDDIDHQAMVLKRRY